MRHARLIRLRRDDDDIIAERAGDLLERHETRRVDAIVIGDENSHRPFLYLPSRLKCATSRGGETRPFVTSATISSELPRDSQLLDTFQTTHIRRQNVG